MRVVSLWTGSTDTVYSEDEVLLTPKDCLNLLHTSKCADHVMRQEGNVWKYECTPTVDSSYLRTAYGEVINCFYENLEQTSAGNAVLSAAAVLANSRQIAYAIRHGQHLFGLKYLTPV